MLFNSLEYAVFLIVVFVIYWAVTKEYRHIVLLLSSCVFYASWNFKLFFLFAFEICLSYYVSELLSSIHGKNVKRCLVFLYCFICIGILVLFKYLDFILSIINNWKNTEPLRLILPMGISFYTFQCMAYVIDVYREKVIAEKSFTQYAAFISFFPQLVAGPIERAEQLLPQIKETHRFEYATATYGLKLMAWGYFKKIVIADTLAITVDKVWENYNDYLGVPLLFVAFFFGIQIYCDFSGYSDIARGSTLVPCTVNKL